MARSREDILEQFQKDVADHKMQILQDDGVRRHLLFKKPSRSPYWFEIVTWENRLIITGDMGTYVFSRLTDMFEFFREDGKGKDALVINPSYWGEKILACDKDRPGSGSYERFSLDLFADRIREEYREFLEEHEDLTQEDKDELEGAVDDLIEELTDDHSLAIQKTVEFEHKVLEPLAPGLPRWEQRKTKATFSIAEPWDWDCNEFTFHFLWICYAIVWSIKQYDAAKVAAERPEGIPAA